MKKIKLIPIMLIICLFCVLTLTACGEASLSELQEQAITALDTALANYDSDDYTTDNYATITAAYDTAKSGINAVTDTANLPGDFVATFTTAADAVLTIAEQGEIDSAAALAAAKATELALLDAELAKYDSDNYTADTYALITTAYDTAKAGIEAVTDIADLPGDFVTTFIASAEAQLQQFTVEFSVGEGSEVQSVYVLEGNKVSQPTTSQQDYYFVGWTLDGEAYDFDTVVSSSITLVAVWELESDWTVQFDDSDNTCAIVRYNGSATDVVVPTYIDGYTVTSLVTDNNTGTFDGNTTIVSVTLPSTVVELGDYCFYDCTSLDSVTIPSTVVELGKSIFYNCTSLDSVYYEGTVDQWATIAFASYSSNPMCNASHFYIANSSGFSEVVTIDITDTVTDISAYAFYGFNNITSVVINPGVESIGDYAFSFCTSLTSVTIPEGVESIGDYAFYDCTALYEISIPTTLTSIGSTVTSKYTIASYNREGTTYIVYDAATLLLLSNSNMFLGFNGTNYYINYNTLQLGADIYFESGMQSSSFTGTLDGTSAMYSIYNMDLLSDNYLYNTVMAATFKNLNIYYNSDWASLCIYSYYGITFENIVTRGDIFIADKESNYSPLVSFGADTSFVNVSAYTNITMLGSGVGFSNFLGGYVLTDCTATFENCVNYGTLIGDNASVFVGQSSYMTSASIVIVESVYNVGTVIGYSNAAYFAALNANGKFDVQEAQVAAASTGDTISVITDTFVVTTDEDDMLVVTPDEQSAATQYLVSYSAYARSSGSTCYVTVTYVVSADDLSDMQLPDSVVLTNTYTGTDEYAADTTYGGTEAMMYCLDGQWYIYVAEFPHTLDVEYTLNSTNVGATIFGVDADLNVVSVQGVE